VYKTIEVDELVAFMRRAAPLSNAPPFARSASAQGSPSVVQAARLCRHPVDRVAERTRPTTQYGDLNQFAAYLIADYAKILATAGLRIRLLA
jgi:hypothetical protein